MENTTNKEPLNLLENQKKVIPKFCTNIEIGLLDNSKNVVFSMIYSEEEGDTSLIEKIVMDLDRVKSLHDTLEIVLREVENENK